MGLQKKLLAIKAYCDHLYMYVLIIARVLYKCLEEVVGVVFNLGQKRRISLLASFFSLRGIPE